MTLQPLRRKTLLLTSAIVLLLLLFALVVLRSGPLAPVLVTVIPVETGSISPALFGIGTVEARRSHKIGPTATSRLLRLEVETGDVVHAGQVLGEMDPVDLTQRIAAQEAAFQRAQSGEELTRAQLGEASLRRDHAASQARRHERLRQARSVSEETADAKELEARTAEAQVAVLRASLEAARRETTRLRAEIDGLTRQRDNLRLIAPVDGLVTSRDADPGSTVVAGQTVVEVIDPAAIRLHVRFDQHLASGLQPGLAARIVLRSRPNAPLAGRVLRVEPRADAVTEELLAKVELDTPPSPLLALGELAKVTIALPSAAPLPTVPNGALHRNGDRLGVWVVDGRKPVFTPVQIGLNDLEGRVQIRSGLEPGTRVVLHSLRPLTPRSRLRIVDRLPGAAP